MAEPKNSIDWSDTLRKAPTEPGPIPPPAPSAPGAGGTSTTQRYEPMATIGEGGMGRVLEARDKQFSRVVAIKELKAGPSDTKARERFNLEALVTGNLEHPGVPAVYERGVRADGTAFYVMRRVRGRSLDEALRECASLEERLKLLPVVMKAAQTVSYAHSQGVVHRDLKPHNILVGPYGEVVVVDWGIAKVRGVQSGAAAGETSGEFAAASGVTETIAGTVMGTPSYMAPEQALGKVDLIDERTDVFSLGAVLYQVLTGRPPYEAANTQSVLLLAAQAKWSTETLTLSAASQQLVEICTKAMAKDSADRYRSAEELSHALENFAANAVANSSFSRLGSSVRIIMVLLSIAFFVFLSFLLWVIPGTFTNNTGWMVTLVLFLIGCATANGHFQSRGRQEMGVLGLGLALANLVLVFAFSVGKIGQQFGTLGFKVGMDLSRVNLDETARVLTLGLGQASSTFSLGMIIVAFQFLIWGFVERVVRMKSRQQ